TTLGQRLLDRIDKYSGEAIAKNYEGVNKYQADDFYKRRMLDANNFVNEYTKLLFPSVEDIVRLNNDVRLISSKRSTILGILLNNPIDKHLFFEVQRHLVLSNIAAELSERSRTFNLNEQVNEVQKELSTNLFKPPFGHTEYAETYAKIDPSTNSVISVYEAQTESKPGDIIRHFQKRMRIIPQEILGGNKDQSVLCEVRTKPRTSEIIKALKKPYESYLSGGSDFIDVRKDVRDTMGLMFVVKGTMDSFEEPVNNTVSAVRKVILNKWPKAKFEVKNHTRDDGTQSKDQKYQRYDVFLDEVVTLPFEMIFYGEGDFLNSEISIGEKKETVDSNGRRNVLFTGRAHDLYKIKQAQKIVPLVMPSSVPFYNGILNLKELANKTLEDTAEKLKLNKQTHFS
ncbi:MAG TPA: hypothetical protein VF189_02520, partial [Patescibacteria group bacterium]